MKSLRRILFVVGLGSFLWGFVPIFLALVVDNRSIDDGYDPDDGQVMSEWNEWAFRPRFVVPTIIGAGTLMASLVLAIRATQP